MKRVASRGVWVLWWAIVISHMAMQIVHGSEILDDSLLQHFP